MPVQTDVFRCVWNYVCESVNWIDGGRLFHTRIAVTEEAWSLSVIHMVVAALMVADQRRLPLESMLGNVLHVYCRDMWYRPSILYSASE